MIGVGVLSCLEYIQHILTELPNRRQIALKYFSSDQVFNELINGDVTREVIYTSMNVARKRKYADREKLFADALARFDEYRKEKNEHPIHR